MERIPQSVAYLAVFRAYLVNGVTLATGKTIAITISKNGAAFGNPNAGATNATEISSGFYKFTLDTTDTGTLGPLAWRGANADILDAGNVMTVASAVTDVNVTQISGDSTAADNLESYLDGSEFMPVDAHQQEWTVTGGTLQPKKPDGTTNTSYSRTVGTDPTAEPIVSST